MEFYRELYVSDKIEHPGIVRWKLRHHAGQPLVYVISLPEDSERPEILHSVYLQEKYYRQNCPLIIGIASGRDDADELLGKILQETLEKTGTINVRDYLLHRKEPRRGENR